MSKTDAAPEIGQTLTKEHLRQLRGGQCPVCGACDEYDFDLGNGYWSCMACNAEFEVAETRHGKSIKSAVRRDITDMIAQAVMDGHATEPGPSKRAEPVRYDYARHDGGRWRDGDCP